MAPVQLHTNLTPWAPLPTQLPEDWKVLADVLAQELKGSPRAYVLKVRYDAQRVGDLLRSWGLPWQVVMAGYLWEYDEKQIYQANLNDADKVLGHINEANLYARYIEDENLPPLLTPPYRDLGALLIAVAIYYQALLALQRKSNEESYTGVTQTHIENVGRTLLNIAKRLGMWGFKRDVEDLVEQLCNPQEFLEDGQEHIRILEQDALLLEDSRQLLMTSYQQATNQSIIVVYRVCGVAGMRRRRQDAHTTATSNKTQLTGFDLVTFDVIVPTVRECYTAFGVLSQLGYIQDRVTDHIANPKPNGCSHIAFGLVLKPQGPYFQSLNWAETSTHICQMQIATHLMQAIAEYGCLYPPYYQLLTEAIVTKERESSSIRQLWNDKEGRVFLSIEESFTAELAQPATGSPIIVYDKSRKPIALPKGATVLDFAYALDNTIGERAVDAIVNNRKAPLYRTLDAGDIVEIRTSHEIQAQNYWESYTTTLVARNQIQESLNRRSLDHRTLLHEALEAYHYTLTPEVLDHELRLLVKKHNLGTVQAYLERFVEKGEPPYTSDWAAQQIMQQISKRNDFVSAGRSNRIPVLDTQQMLNKRSVYKQRLCGFCQPTYPYDLKIIGRVRKRSGVLVVHRESCPYLVNRAVGQHSELLPMTWKLHPPASRVAFFVTAQDRTGLLLDITKRLRRHQYNVLLINAEVNLKLREAYIRFTIETYADKEVLEALHELSKIESVTKVEIDAANTPFPIYEHLHKLLEQSSILPDRTAAELTWEKDVAALERRSSVLKNPYDISRPATGKMFIGRSEEMKRMRRELCDGERGKALILYGPRRSGKSSICKNFLEREVQPPFWHVLFSLQNATKQSEGEILCQLADEVCRKFSDQLHQPVHGWHHYNESNPQICFKRVVQGCLAQVPDTRLVLALDEFGGALDSYQQGCLDYRFFSYWKELMSELPQLSLIIALPTSAHSLLSSRAFSYAFNFAESLPIMFLDQESSERLLVDPLKDQQIAIHPNTVAFASKLTGGNPYYMTLVGKHLIDRLNQEPQKQQVLNEDLHLVVDQIIEPGANQYFSFYRTELQSDDEIHILEGFVELTTRSNQTVVQLKKIANWLRLPDTVIRQHLERLRNGLILEEHHPKESTRTSSNPSYSFKIELLRIWLARNHWFFSLSTK